MEVMYFSETSGDFQQTTLHYKPEDGILHTISTKNILREVIKCT
jgi:hypothetical protein